MGEAIAAGIVGAALLWLVLQPVLMPQVSAPVYDDVLDIEETPQGRALLAIKEIEFDRATGKLSDDDFAMLHAKYSALAVAAIENQDASQVTSAAGDPVEAMIAARVAALAPRFCADCGSELSDPPIRSVDSRGSDAAFRPRQCPRCNGPAILPE